MQVSASKKQEPPREQPEVKRGDASSCPILKVIYDQSENVCPLIPVLQELPTGVVIANQRGEFTVFNREAQRMVGLGPQDVGAGEWSDTYGCYRPDKVTPFPAESLPLARALRGEEVSGELIFIRNSFKPDGVWIRASSKPLKNIEEESGSAVVVFSDVTQRQKAVERIELLSKAVEQTADSVVITDTCGVIRYVNPAFEVTTGYSRDEAVGKTPRILKSGQHGAEFYGDMWAEILRGNAFRGMLVNRKKSGELYWAQQTITPIRDDAGNISQFVSVLKDMTEVRKQQEHEIQIRLARQAQQRFYAAAVPPAGMEVGRAVWPAAETGGDYIDFVKAPNGRVGIAIGDVSGHGFDSALLMALTRAYVRSYSAQGLKLPEILAGVNGMLVADLEEDRYVTLLLVHVDPAQKALSYASAGHVSGFIMADSGEVDCLMASTGLPLGMFDHYQGESRNVGLKAGSLVVLLTYGATDAGAPCEDRLGVEGVITYVRAHRDESPQQIADGICQCARARSFAPDRPQHDDIAAVVLKIR